MKKVLKLARPNKRNAYQLGTHTITRTATEFDLEVSELKELQGKGAKHWIVEVKEEKAKKVSE